MFYRSTTFLLRSLIWVFVCAACTCFPIFASSVPEEVFTNIYQNKVWGVNEQGEGFSGGGSTLRETTIYRKFLQNFLKEYAIQSVVDVGCGDWTFSRTMDWSGIKYIGVDVVKSVIEKNIQLFATSSVHFIQADLLATELPRADLLICKDVLQHLPNAEVIRFIKQLGTYKYCLITNDVNPQTLSSTNPDIKIGTWRPIDLTRPPFSINGVKILLYNRVKQVLLIKNEPSV